MTTQLKRTRSTLPELPKIFRMIRAGESWDKAANKLYKGGSFGNGAAMRVAPIGFLYSTNPAKLREITYKSSIITHSHELGEEGAALQACSIPTAIYSLLKHPKSYTNPVLYAISLGGDMDTIAAMAGEISGAYLGVEAIPDRWKGELENRPYIEALAQPLFSKEKRMFYRWSLNLVYPRYI